MLGPLKWTGPLKWVGTVRTNVGIPTHITAVRVVAAARVSSHWIGFTDRLDPGTSESFVTC